MTTLSALDVRFACLCGGASSAHSIGAGLRMRCEHCKECEGYRPARCVCHVSRDDGTPIRCYAEAHDGDDGLATSRSPLFGDSSRPDQRVAPLASPFWSQLAAARDEKILAEAGPNPGPEYVLVADNNGRYSYQTPHRAHKRLRGLSARYRVCQECGDSLLAWMAARSGNVHMQQRAADYIKANNVPGYQWLLDRYYPEAS